MDLTGGWITQYFGRKKAVFLLVLIFILLFISREVSGQRQVLDSAFHHLRNTGTREWSEFSETAEATRLRVSFSSQSNESERTLALRQYDVKARWRVVLNGQPLGGLIEDEKNIAAYLKIPPGLLQRQNTLEIYTSDRQPDDIRVGHIVLHEVSVNDLLSEGHLDVSVVEDGVAAIPARITIINDEGTLQTFSAQPHQELAIRPGYLYMAKGHARVGLPAGTYSLYATRGFEYGVDSARVVVKAGDNLRHRFNLSREVSTRGWASSDTHIHTFTWSRHGDASAAERVISIAGEGLELPVITDHNIHVDLQPYADSLRLDGYFTPVMGNEVTTRVGHFNVFPVRNENVINHNIDDWATLSASTRKSNKPQVIILNHARDIHQGFRPFDPSKHLSAAGTRLDGWEFPANAMEVINSGSQQTDQLELIRDWFGMMNGGHVITPVGSSDSHDVSRFIVGQARTYIRCNDEDAGNIDVDGAVKNFLDGNVMVSFGLLAEIEVNDAYGPGELAPPSDEVKVSIKVSGPSWTRARRVTLYANGKKIRHEEIDDQNKAGLKWSGEWKLTLPSHDVFLVALAQGPSDDLPFWPIAKPFQPVSTEWSPGIFALSGAVWLDGDTNGKRNSARDYAETLVKQCGSDMNLLIQKLAAFNESVSVQAAAILHRKGKNLRDPEITGVLENASPDTRSGFQRVVDELEKGRDDTHRAPR